MKPARDWLPLEAIWGKSYEKSPQEQKFFGSFFKKELLFFLVLSSTAKSEPAIWLVQSPTAKVYLFGTMHVLPKKTDWFGPKIANAFAQSHMLVEEADVSPGNGAAVQGMMTQAIAPDYDLWSKLSGPKAAQLRTQIAKCHLPDAVVGHFRPWFASTLPTMCEVLEEGGPGFSIAGASPELALIKRARDGQMSLGYMETVEEQIRLLSSGTEAFQIKELEGAIAEGDKTASDLARMQSAWQSGDVAEITKMVGEERSQSAELYDATYTQRNRRFAARIDGFLHGAQTVFVAIGAAHLAGPDSVQAQLALLSYTAKRL